MHTKTRLVLLLHWSEVMKTANTGRIAMQQLANHEMHLVGDPQGQIDWSSMCDDNWENLFLFPAQGAEILTPNLVKSFEKPVRLIVADGNWGQASRMHRRMIESSSPRRVILPPGPPSEYKLRTAPDKSEGVSTIEAIARALEILESSEVADHLLAVFKIMVDRNLFARGKLARDLVTGGVPKWG
jgi:DTW domain-containing protein YfiP